MTGSLRVVRVLTRLNVGGPARQALALQGEMERLGVETVLVCGAVQDGEADLADMLGFGDVVRLPTLGRRVSPADDAVALRDLRRLLRRIRPQVVHTHMAKAGAVGRIAALAARVPVRVHTFHGHTLHGYFGRAGTAGVVASERSLARISTALVAVSRQVRQDLLARGIGRPDRFYVMDAGLDLGDFWAARPRDVETRSLFGIPPHARVIALVGRLVPVKGIDVFLAAVEPLLRERDDLHVVVAGDGPEVGRVRSAIESMPGGSRIHAPGWVVDVARLYASVDVVALSSRNEGTPLSLIEASAAGVPVVATAVGGVPEVVLDGETGLLVPGENPHALARALRRVLDDRDLAGRLASAGHERSRRYGAARLAEGLVGLYGELLERPRAVV